MGSCIFPCNSGVRGESWWAAELRIVCMLVLVNGTQTKRDETSTSLKSEVLSHWCKNVTCLLKRKHSEGKREEGLLHNHLRQWLIIIMRQISGPTGGLYEPPTLHIYFSFSLLLLPTSCVWPFRSSFCAVTQICNMFSLHRLLCISFPLPVFPPVPSLPFLFFPQLIFFVSFFF